jgi:hypothetical protein
MEKIIKEGTIGYVHIEDVHIEVEIPEPQVYRDVEFVEIKI